MAGNYLTINARFRPLSYQEMAAPVQLATEYHRLLEDEYSQLGADASVWLGMLNQNDDALSYTKTQQFNKSLEEISNELATSGLSPSSRLKLMSMKQLYAKEILPIANATGRRKELIDEYRKMQALNPTLLSSMNPSKMSIDQLVSNPTMSPSYDNGSLITAKVADAVKSYAQKIKSEGSWKKTAFGLMLEKKDVYGLTQEDIMKIVLGGGDPELESIISNAIKSSGAANWDNAKELEPLMRQYAILGLYHGIGGVKTDTQRNADFISAESNRNYNLNREQFDWLKLKDVATLAIALDKADNASGGKGKGGSYLRARPAIATEPTIKEYSELKQTLGGRVKDKVTGKIYDPVNAYRIVNKVRSELLKLELKDTELKVRSQELSKSKNILPITLVADYGNPEKALSLKSNKPNPEVDKELHKITTERMELAKLIHTAKSKVETVSSRLEGKMLNDQEYKDILTKTGAVESDDVQSIYNRFGQLNKNLIYRTDFYDYNRDTDEGKKIKSDIEGSLYSTLRPYTKLGETGKGVYKLDGNLTSTKPVHYRELSKLLEKRDIKGSITEASKIDKWSLNPQVMKQFKTPHVVVLTLEGDRYVVDASLISELLYNTLANGWEQATNAFATNDIELGAQLTNEMMKNSSSIFGN